MALDLIALLFWRALRLRCVRCGKGKIFKHGFTANERCPHCGWVFEREQGYWTGGMAMNIVVCELLVAVVVVPLAAIQTPLLPLFLIGIPATILLPFLFYRHAMSLWMALDFCLHPTSLQ